MENIYQSEAQQAEMDRRGVLTLPLLRPEEVANLRAFYDGLHPDGIPPQMRDGIHMTIWCSDLEYKLKVRDKLFSVLGPACARIFQDFRIVSPVFIVKRKGGDTTFPIHQDWNVVDEEAHRAFNIWVPLHDVDETRGSLWVVEGSHRLPNHVRGPGLLFPNLYGIREHVAPLMKAINVKAGEGMVFYHRIIHGSPPNVSEEPRVVIAFSLLPKAVPMHIYFQRDHESPLQIYHPPDDFIYHIDNVRDDTPYVPPQGVPVETRPSMHPEPMTPAYFDRAMGRAPVKAPASGFLGGLKRLFSKA